LFKFTTARFRAYCAKLSKCRRLDLKTLEGSTSTHISIPTSGNLVITGESEEKIVEARDEIHAMLGDLRDQTVALQFVSIPTLSTEIVENFTKFKVDSRQRDRFVNDSSKQNNSG
jgi:hypothetical protein